MRRRLNADPKPPGFQALYNKYRPRQFAEFVAQPHVVRTLQNALRHNRVSHAYLFSGERGTGKTTAARLLAKAVNCLEGVQAEPCDRCAHCQSIAQGTFLDLIELDAASHTGVDDIRELRDAARYSPGEGRHKVYIIDEIHQLSAAAKDALLKTLEEPPPQTLFVLATTEPHRVPATIRSRCQHLTFRRLAIADLTTRLAEIAEREGASATDAALNMLARNASGSLRDAISLLDQALAFADGPVTVEQVNNMLGLTGRDAVVALLGDLASGNTAEGLTRIEEAIQQGNSAGTLQQQIVDVLRELLLVKTASTPRGIDHLTEDESRELAALAGRVDLRQAVRALEAFAEPEASMRGGTDASLGLELAFARATLQMHDSTSPSEPAPTTTPAAPAREERPSYAGAESQPRKARREPADLPPAEIAARAAAEGQLNAEVIRTRSSDWIERIRSESRSVAPYAEQAEVLGFAEGVVTLGYRSEFLIERMERVDARQMVQRALSQVFDAPIEVRNQLQRGVEQPRRSAPGSRASDDPVVRVAMREYGAEPVDRDKATGA